MTGRLAVFQLLKTTLTEGSVLVSPDEEKQFLLFKDAPRVGICAIFNQAGVGGPDRHVAYYSRKLKPAETK